MLFFMRHAIEPIWIVYIILYYSFIYFFYLFIYLYVLEESCSRLREVWLGTNIDY